MKKKPKEKYEEYIRNLVNILQAKMGLGEWKISVLFVKSLPDRKKRYPDGYSADIDVDYRYLDAEVRVSNKVYLRWLAGEYRVVASTMVHELAHILTDPYREIAKMDSQYINVDERQTERIARAIMNCLHWEDYYVDVMGIAPT